MGYEALYTATGVDYQTAIGYQALKFSTTGIQNLAIGYQAGSSITTGSNNIAIGYNAQVSLGTASNQLNIGNWIYGNNGNIAIGASGATATSIFEIWSGSVNYLNFRGTNNIGMGAGALRIGMTGNADTAFGNEALYTMTTGYSNSAFGHQALRQSTAGFNNSAFGKEAMYNDNDGTWNTAIGYQALRVATSSDYNVAIGGQSLYNLGTGTGNVAIGHNALYGATSTASNNTVLGYMAGSGITSGWGNIAIGNGTQVVSNTSSNQMNIGNWIYGSGGNIGIGTGASVALTARLNIDGGANNVSGLRMNRLSNTSTTYTGASIGLGIDASGNVVPVSNGDVVVYTAGNPASPPTPNPDIANRDISYDYNKYFDIPTAQSFVVSDGSSTSYNGPFFRENGTSGVCSWNGTYGTSPYACSGNDTYGVPASPANSFTMTAKGSTYGYQLALGARGDAPLFARSGRFNGAVGG